MTRRRLDRPDDSGASMIMALMFFTGVGLVVTALLTYSAGGLRSAKFTADAAQSAAAAEAALETAVNDVRNSVYTNDGITPCLTAGQRTYTALVTGGLPATVTCKPDPASGVAGSASVPINITNRPANAVLVLGTYSGGAAPGVEPATPGNIVVSPAGDSQGSPVLITGSNIAGATAVQIGTSAQIATATAATLSPCPGGVAAAGCFTTSGDSLIVSAMPNHAAGLVEVKVITLGTAGSGSFSYQTVPAAPVASAAAGWESATVTWTAPNDGGSSITGYVVTPYRAGVAQTAIVVAASPTSATISGLTVNTSYTFTVAAINDIGISAASPVTNAVLPYAIAPYAPTIGTPSAGTLGATVRWTAPAEDGGSAITGYVVTPYLNGVAQAAQSFASTATSQPVTGLASGASYTFTVRATNVIGLGAPSGASTAVTTNAAMVITSGPTLPAGRVNVVYTTTTLVRTGGTSTFTWTLSAGSFPPGLVLSTAGVISGRPTSSGGSPYNFTVKVVDSFGANTTKNMTIVIAAAKQGGPAERTLETGAGTVITIGSVDQATPTSGVRAAAAPGLVGGRQSDQPLQSPDPVAEPRVATSHRVVRRRLGR